ncbi:MAG TPA: hypothetical protein VEY50_04305 [Lysobacter sp.]|nr:hypothetical protein [Lysobacter sp.]
MARGVAVLLFLLLAGCAGVTALLGDSLAFTQAQLQQQLERRFPRDYPQAGGLLSLSLLNPRLSIPPGDDRLHVAFDVGIGTLGRSSRTPAGRFALTSGLRFDPATRGLHLDAPRLEDVAVPALGGTMNATVRDALNAWLLDYARNEPVYRLDDGLLARLGARRIARTRIADGQVRIELEN